MTSSVRTLWKLQSAVEQAGIEFIPGDESKGPGGGSREPEQATKSYASLEEGGRASNAPRRPFGKTNPIAAKQHENCIYSNSPADAPSATPKKFLQPPRPDIRDKVDKSERSPIPESKPK